MNHNTTASIPVNRNAQVCKAINHLKRVLPRLKHTALPKWIMDDHFGFGRANGKVLLSAKCTEGGKASVQALCCTSNKGNIIGKQKYNQL